VDDTTGGAQDVKAAKQVSQDMEDILENGGFHIKETVMTGDSLGEEGELRKVCIGTQVGHRRRRDLCGCKIELWREGERSSY
jgi:hypothetical protein